MTQRSQSPARLPAPHLAALALVGGLIATCIIIETCGFAQRLPVLRGTLGTALFATAPGLILFSYLCLFQPHRFTGLTIFLLSTSLSFTSTFGCNVVVFSFGFDLRQAYVLYVSAIAAGYAVLIGLLRRRDPRLFAAMAAAVRARRVLLVKLGAGAAVLIAAMSFKWNPGLYIEELFTIRKLAELPAITWNSTSLTSNTPNPYLFVPFYLLLGLISQFCRIDVIGAIFEALPYLSLIAVCLTVKLALLISNDRRAISVTLTATAALIVFVPLHSSNMFIAVIPTVDRYGVAVAILMPLAFFHFLMHMRDERVNFSMIVGLVYLIVEISFVHARETLHFLGLAVITVAVLFALGVSAPARRGVAAIALVVGVLWVYRTVALWIGAEELSLHLTTMAKTMWSELDRIVHERSFARFFGFAGAEVAYTAPIRLRDYASLPVFPLLMWLILPLYALAADNALRLSLCATVIATGLFSLMNGVKFMVGLVIGSWHVFDVDSFLMMLLFLMFVDFVLRMPDALRVIRHHRSQSPASRLRAAAIAVPLLATLLLLQATFYQGPDFPGSTTSITVAPKLPPSGSILVLRIASVLGGQQDYRHTIAPDDTSDSLAGDLCRQINANAVGRAVHIACQAHGPVIRITNVLTNIAIPTALTFPDVIHIDVQRTTVFKVMQVVRDYILHVQHTTGSKVNQVIRDYILLIVGLIIAAIRMAALRGAASNFSFSGYGRVRPTRPAPWALTLLCAAALAGASPGPLQRKAANLASFATSTDSSKWNKWCVAGDKFEIYRCLNDEGLLHLFSDKYPGGYAGRATISQPLLEFIGTLPPGETFIGTDTIPLLIVAPMYTPTVTYDGHILVGGFIINDVFAHKYAEPFVYWKAEGPLKRLRLDVFFEDAKSLDLLRQAIDEYRAAYILAGPHDSAVIRDRLAGNPDLADEFEAVYYRDGYLILKIRSESKTSG
jgi:hypothetical protein